MDTRRARVLAALLALLPSLAAASPARTSSPGLDPYAGYTRLAYARVAGGSYLLRSMPLFDVVCVGGTPTTCGGSGGGVQLGGTNPWTGPNSFIDGNFSIIGSGDPTKILKFEVDGFTTLTTRTVTFPDANLTVAGLGTTNAFTGTNSFLDGGLSFKNSADPTKIAVFDLSGITTGNTITGLKFGGTAASPFVLLDGTGASGTPQLKLNGGIQFFGTATPLLDIGTSAVGYAQISSSGILMPSGGPIHFSSGAIRAAGSDTGLARNAAGVLAATGASGTTANGWFQQAGDSMLTADYTNATATFSSTALSVTVTSGRKYTFQAVLFLIDSTAAEGAQVDFNGGTATATNFRVHCLHYDTTAAVLKSTQVTALATVADSVASTGTGQNELVCNGSFEPSGNGTFIIRGAQVSHTTGTLTINRGSFLTAKDMP